MDGAKEREARELKEQKEILAREGHKQKQRPESDIFQDTMNDRGQKVEDELRTEETEET